MYRSDGDTVRLFFCRTKSGPGGQIAYNEYECTNPTPDPEIPDAGISDVEPRFFLDTYHLAPNAVDVLSVHNANAFIFGVPVTLKLRDALQSARFAKDDACNPANPRYAQLVEVGRGTRFKRGETEACMPSLSRAQLAGIFAGTVTDWGHIVNAQGYALTAKNQRTGQMISPPGVRPPSDGQVYICRRVPTSGTQAAFEMFFLNERCTDASVHGVRQYGVSGFGLECCRNLYEPTRPAEPLGGDLLGQVPDLRVPARTSSFYFKGKNETIANIAQQLKVAHVLEGSVRKAGKRLRITVMLSTGMHVYSLPWVGCLRRLRRRRRPWREGPAFEWLERAYWQRDGGLAEIKADPTLKSLRTDPRFNALLRKLKLPE